MLLDMNRKVFIFILIIKNNLIILYFSFNLLSVICTGLCEKWGYGHITVFQKKKLIRFIRKRGILIILFSFLSFSHNFSFRYIEMIKIPMQIHQLGLNSEKIIKLNTFF